MGLLTDKTSIVLWQDAIKAAADRCTVALEEDLESYLIALLMRYTNKPELIRQIFATAFLDALQRPQQERNNSLQHVGDQCLLFAGLFPQAAHRKNVKLSYFVDIGRSAYAHISQQMNDVYWSLALQFVVLMDILQSIRPSHDLMPLEAYEQWREVGSQRALKILREYSQMGVAIIPPNK